MSESETTVSYIDKLYASIETVAENFGFNDNSYVFTGEAYEEYENLSYEQKCSVIIGTYIGEIQDEAILEKLKWMIPGGAGIYGNNISEETEEIPTEEVTEDNTETEEVIEDNTENEQNSEANVSNEE